MTHRQHRIMELARRVEGVTYEEIASKLNISESTARLDCWALSRQGYIALKIRQVPEVAGTGWGAKHVWRAEPG